MKRVFTSILILFTMIPLVIGQTTEKKKYRATRVSEPPQIDGILSEEIWNTQGKWINDFTQHEPYNGRQASQRTEFKILFDDNNLYVGVKNFDTSPDSIVNRLTRRDHPDGDLCGVIFDSFHDLRTAFLFGIASSGVKYDMIFTEDGQNEDPSWDPNWWVKTSINKEGWIAEMKIPFSQLRFDKNSGDVWGLQIARVLYRKNETSFWEHLPKDAPGFIHLLGEMEGLDGIKPRKIFDVTPYAIAKMETFKKEPENPFRSKGRLNNLNGGLDAKIGITNNMTMDLTINPDFGQVEADPSEVNLTAYETFFEEKRPFFIEGNNITNFNLGLGDGDVGNDNLFYTRRIGRQPEGYPDLQDNWYANVPTSTTILGAAKITGKTKNGLSVGFIDAVTAGEVAEIDTIAGRMKEPVEPLTNFFIGRVQRDFKDGNTLLGAIFTGTNRDVNENLGSFMNKSAYTGGFDFTQFFKEKSWSFNLNAAFSQVNGSKEAISLAQKSSARYYQRPDNDYTEFDPNRTSLFGSGGRMQIMKMNGHLNLIGCVLWKTPGFEINDLGYMQQADRVLTVLWGGYNVWEPKGIYRQWRINADVFLENNFGGEITSKGFEYGFGMTFKNYWNFNIGGNISGNNLSTGMLRGGPSMKIPGQAMGMMGISTDSRKKLVFELFLNGGLGYHNYSNRINVSPEVTYKPTNYLSVSISGGYSQSFNELQYVTKNTYGTQDRFVFASIDRKTINASIRVNLNLSPDLTIQYWGQPYIASGKYYDHKFVTEPMHDTYSDRYWTYTSAQKSFNESENRYYIDEDADGTSDYSFGNSNFNYQFFLSNLVARWEYNPGSSVYLVWSQSRNFNNETGEMDFFNDIGDLFNKENNIPHNVFLIKFSYRFGLR